MTIAKAMFKADLGTVYTYVEQMPQPPGGGGSSAVVALI